jgi:hypothetical protein
MAAIFPILAAVIACSAFFWGFSQSTPDSGTLYGAAVGLGSAITWAAASACGGNTTLSNWFNLFAAVFAALSLGYLTPAEPLCRAVDGFAWAGRSIPTDLLCRYRAIPTKPSDVEALRNDVSRLHRTVNELRFSIEELKNKTNEFEGVDRILKNDGADLDRRLRILEGAADSNHATSPPHK